MGGTRVLKLEELAVRLHGQVVGNASVPIEGIAPLAEAGPRHLSFLANARYLTRARCTGAAAILVSGRVDLPGMTLLVVPDAYAALAAALDIFHPPEPPPAGISPAALVGSGVVFGDECSVQAGARIGDRCHVGAHSVIMPGAVLGRDVQVGERTAIHPNVTVYDGCTIGSRVIIHAGAVIGSDGFGFARQGEQYRKIPQVGNVIIEDDVELGANVTVDRATFGSTRIGRGTKIDNLVQIGHNVQIGENSILVAQSGISGSTRIGRGVTFAGQSGAVGHIEIGDGAVIGAKSAVTHDLSPGQFVIGHPAIEARTWKRAIAVFAKLPELLARLRRLEAQSRAPREDRADPENEKEV